MGIEYKAMILGITIAAFAGAALAHGNKHDAKPAAKAAVKAEQKPFGIAGDAKKVSRTIKMDMTDEMRFHPAVLEFKRGETVRTTAATDQ